MCICIQINGQNVKKNYGILKTSNDTTLQLSGVCYPTEHLVLMNYCIVAVILNEHSSYKNLKYYVEVMKSK